jgi:energy-coupling factor transporter ATP-binding protein EcfA2
MYRFQVKDPSFLPHIGCDVEFSLNKSELLALVGENGIGKSSLVQRFSQEMENVVLVEQRAPDYFFDRQLKKIKEIFLASVSSYEGRKTFARYWNNFNLDQKEDRYLSSLSGGEGQALKICLNLSIPKEIYLLDEPSQSLDKRSKDQLRLILSELLEAGKAVVVIEHDTSWLPRPLKVVKLESRNQNLVLGESWTI